MTFIRTIPNRHSNRLVRPGLAILASALMLQAASGQAPLFTFDFAQAANGGVADRGGLGVTLRLGKGVTVQADAPGGGASLNFPGTPEGESSFTLPADFAAALKGDEVSVSFWLRAHAFSDATIGLGYTLGRWGVQEQAPLRFNLSTQPTAFGAYGVWTGTDRPMHTGAWHHVAFVYSLSNLHFTATYDGRQQASYALAHDEPSPLANILQPLGKDFSGSIADIRIWKRAVATNELLAFRPTSAEVEALKQRFAAARDGAVHAPFKAWCDTISRQIDAQVKTGPISIRDWQQYRDDGRKLEALADATGKLAPPSPMASAPFCSFTFDPYSDQKRLPHILPLDGRGTDTLKTALAKGEYEGLTFMLFPFANVAKFEIQTTPLTSGTATLPADALTIRVVKCWHNPQSGWNTYFGGGREFPTLAPELLLFDDALIKTDEAKRRNYLRVDYPEGPRYVDISVPGLMINVPSFNYMIEPVRDAATLQPLPLVMGRNQQFWVTVHAPSNAAPGLYTGRLKLLADGAPAGELNLEVTVHPFVLPRPMTSYDLSREYYGTLMHHVMLSDQLTLGKNRAQAEKRLLAEMKNMVAHNMLHPHSPGFDKERADEISIRHYEIMREAGMPLKPVWAGGAMDGSWFIQRMQYPRTSPETDPAGFAAAMARQKKSIDRKAALFDKVLGHRDVYLYGWDEAGPSGVRHEFPFFAYAKSQGFKIFITSGVSEWASFIVDANDEPASIRRSESEKWHVGGAINTSYAAPFTGPENPELWRRNKGIRMYLANYDGLNEYNWYEGYHIWNEYLGPNRYKNFAIVYPTFDGVIDTIAWESLREAFDDIRYATLLRQRAALAMAADGTPMQTTARKALLWLTSIDPEVIDLDEMRGQMVQWILQLDQALASQARQP